MKVAIITGAAQGIGRKTAEVLAAGGYSLGLMDIQSCDTVAAAVRALGVGVEAYSGDISDESVVRDAVDAVQKRWGRVDVLVNNAGISFIAPAEARPIRRAAATTIQISKT